MTSEKKMTLQEKVMHIRNEAEAPRLNCRNPHFKSLYADLGEVKRVIEPLLTKYEVSAGFVCNSLEGEERLILSVESGDEMMTSSMFLRCTDPQKRGSELTYGRRYLWNAFWNLVADEDDDGEAAHGRTSPPQPVRPKASTKTSPETLFKQDSKSPDIAEIKQRYAAEARKRGAKTREDLVRSWTNTLAKLYPGKDPEEVTFEEAKAALKGYLDMYRYP